MTARDKILNPNLLLALLIAVIGMVFTVQSVNKPLSDWGNYYYGSNFLVKGEFSKDVYEPYKFNMMVRQQGETDIFLNYTPIPPFTALFYVPFQLTSSRNAKLIFNIISVLIFAITVYRFTKFLGISSWWLLAVPIALILPMRSNIFFGQTYLLIIAMLMEGYISYRADRKFPAALLWSAAILLKLFPGIILLFLLFKKDYKMLGITVGILAAASIITAAVTGFRLNAEYLTHIMPRIMNNEINDTYASSYQSMLVLLNKVFIYDKLLNPGGTMNSPLLLKILNLLYSFTILYICAIFTMKKDANDYIKFSLWILAGLMITGYGSAYSLLLLIFIALAAVKQYHDIIRQIIVTFVLLAAISSVPVNWFSGLNVLMQFPRLYLFIIFFITVLIFFKVRPGLKYIYAVPLLAIVIGYLTVPPAKNNSEYVFDKEEALLIYDYYEVKGRLKIKYLDQNGTGEKILDYPAQLSEISQIEIKDNHINYDGRELLSSGGNILNPKLNGQNEIYFLSDHNRGVGFYTLRKILTR